MSFKFVKTPLEGLVHIETQVHRDNRGFLFEIYRESDFKNAGIKENFVQLTTSESSKYVLRGLHYQINPCSQGKLVSVMSGSIFDVAVDIRKGSKTYGGYFGVELSAEKGNLLYIPVGFAHGFCALRDKTIMIYVPTSEYSGEYSRGIAWNDPEIGIKWPVDNPILSDKDAKYPKLSEAENNFAYLKS